MLCLQFFSTHLGVLCRVLFPKSDQCLCSVVGILKAFSL